jgi:UDP-N-acetyl-D-glucosamine dehydrogenase
MKVAIVGQGYVGLPLAIAAAHAGHDVTGIDSNQLLVSTISNGESPIGDISNHQITAALASRHYRISNAYDAVSDAQIVIICVPTPLNIHRKPDLTFLQSALNCVVHNLKSGVLVINESTVAPGTTRTLVADTLSRAKVDFELAYSPERIDPANSTWNVTNTPKLVAGLTNSAGERASAFYKTFISDVRTGNSLEVIETAKLLENSFRFINISFINEVAQFCSALDIDVQEVIEAAASKPYGFMPFYPSAGVGGHCIPVDPIYLANKSDELGIPSRFINLAQEFNLQLPTFFAGVATGLLGNLKGKKILLIGVAYKPDVADTRETPAQGLITALRNSGALVSWHDDLVNEWNGETSLPITNDFDLAILVNPHSTCELALLGSTPVLNTRGGY